MAVCGSKVRGIDAEPSVRAAPALGRYNGDADGGRRRAMLAFNGGPFVFRVNDNGAGPSLLVEVCLERGWREFNDSNSLRDNWNLWWRTSGFPLSHYKQLKSWQFTNHIPKGSQICRKDNLARHLRCMKKVYGSIYDFSPACFNLPLEYTKLVAECARVDDRGHPVWICKPASQSQGRGIFLFTKLSELWYSSSSVVQRYIKNPLLIGGYKFDLRLYVVIPSYHPLTVYLYREGLARFGTDKFSLADLDNPFRHLTNSSVNKFGPGYTEHKERIGAGCKWTLTQLRRYFHQAGIDDWLLWQRVATLVVLTVTCQLPAIPDTTNCFEFYGFDVLVDSELRPWLLEVNLSPALGNDCDADYAVKKPMLHDMFDLLGLPICNTGLSLYTNLEPEEPLSVAAAASRWKRCKSARKRARHVSATSTVVVGESVISSVWAPNSPSVPHRHSYKPRQCWSAPVIKPSSSWGNGRDWTDPPVGEGSWSLIYPLKKEVNQDNEPTARTIVSAVNKYLRTARELRRKNTKAPDEQLAESIAQAGFLGWPWLPNK